MPNTNYWFTRKSGEDYRDPNSYEYYGPNPPVQCAGSLHVCAIFAQKNTGNPSIPEISDALRAEMQNALENHQSSDNVLLRSSD
jgi:hypothetical protein